METPLNAVGVRAGYRPTPGSSLAQWCLARWGPLPGLPGEGREWLEAPTAQHPPEALGRAGWELGGEAGGGAERTEARGAGPLLALQVAACGAQLVGKVRPPPLLLPGGPLLKRAPN